MLLAKNELVRVIVHHDDAMLLGKAHQPLVGLTLGSASSRHIGIIRPDELHLREIHFFEFIEIWLPAIVLTKVVVHDLGT